MLVLKAYILVFLKNVASSEDKTGDILCSSLMISFLN